MGPNAANMHIIADLYAEGRMTRFSRIIYTRFHTNSTGFVTFFTLNLVALRRSPLRFGPVEISLYQTALLQRPSGLEEPRAERAQHAIHHLTLDGDEIFQVQNLINLEQRRLLKILSSSESRWSRSKISSRVFSSCKSWRNISSRSRTKISSTPSPVSSSRFWCPSRL